MLLCNQVECRRNVEIKLRRETASDISNSVYEQGIICSRSCWCSKLWSCIAVCSGHHMPNHQKISANLHCAVAELWDREQTGAKTSERYKNVLFKYKKCWYCSKMAVGLTAFCRGSKYWTDKKDLLLSHSGRGIGRRERSARGCIKVSIWLSLSFNDLNNVFITTETHFSRKYAL